MFGRSRDEASPVYAPVNPTSGRAAAISILPGLALPAELVPPAPEPAYLPDAPVADERVLVPAGGPAFDAESGSDTDAPAAPAPAKSSTFFGIRLRGKSAPAEPESFFGDEPATGPEPVHSFSAPEVTDAPSAFAPDAFAPPVFDAPTAPPAFAPPTGPAFEAPAPPAFVPDAFAPPAPPVEAAAPVVDEPVLEDAGFTDEPQPQPPVYVPLDTPAVPAVPAVPVAEAPVLDAPVVDEPVAQPAAGGLTALARTFLDRLRGAAAPVVDEDAHVEDPFAHSFPAAAPVPAPALGVTPPPPYVPGDGAADGPAVPAFAHLVPTHQIAFPDQIDEMATQVAAQVADEHEAPAEDAPEMSAPTVGLVFADGSHAELGEGPDGAALQQVARVLAGDPAPAPAEDA